MQTRKLLIGLVILTLGTIMSTAWYNCYEMLLHRMFGKDVVKEPWFCIANAIFWTILVLVIVELIDGISLKTFGIPGC